MLLPGFRRQEPAAAHLRVPQLHRLHQRAGPGEHSCIAAMEASRTAASSDSRRSCCLPQRAAYANGESTLACSLPQAISADNEFYAIWAALGFTRAPLYTGVTWKAQNQAAVLLAAGAWRLQSFGRRKALGCCFGKLARGVAHLAQLHPPLPTRPQVPRATATRSRIARSAPRRPS